MAEELAECLQRSGSWKPSSVDASGGNPARDSSHSRLCVDCVFSKSSCHLFFVKSCCALLYPAARQLFSSSEFLLNLSYQKGWCCATLPQFRTPARSGSGSILTFGFVFVWWKVNRTQSEKLTTLSLVFLFCFFTFIFIFSKSGAKAARCLEQLRHALQSALKKLCLPATLADRQRFSCGLCACVRRKRCLCWSRSFGCKLVSSWSVNTAAAAAEAAAAPLLALPRLPWSLTSGKNSRALAESHCRPHSSSSGVTRETLRWCRWRPNPVDLPLHHISAQHANSHHYENFDKSKMLDFLGGNDLEWVKGEVWRFSILCKTVWAKYLNQFEVKVL